MNCCNHDPCNNGVTFNANMGQVNAFQSNYNKLINKPSINGIELVGNKTSQELGIDSDKNYVYSQTVASDVWDIEHNLKKYPSVTIVDSGGNGVVGEVTYLSKDKVQVSFSAAFSGKAYLN